MAQDIRINNAFKELRKRGYFARQNFMCCQTCGWAGVPDNKADKAVFYHAQDKEHLEKTGKLYLAWAGDEHQNRAQEYLAKTSYYLQYGTARTAQRLQKHSPIKIHFTRPTQSGKLRQGLKSYKVMSGG